MNWLQDDPDAPGYHVDPGDNEQFPKNDNGENFIFTVLALPFRAAWTPIRLLAGIVGARRIDDEIAKRGVYEGEENPEIVDEVIDEHAARIFGRGRRR